jgi:hypothetical protein
VTDLVVFHRGEVAKGAESTGARLLPLEKSLDYRFPVGPVVGDVVYVLHPLDEGVLIPFGMYDEYLLRDKFNEALRIVTSLGASEVVSQTITSDARDGGAEAAIQGQGLRVKGQRAQRAEVNYHQAGTGGPPIDPRPLRWPDEPGFDSACVSVLRNGATEVDVSVSSDQTFSVESDVAGVLKKAGFALGGNYRRTRAVSYVLKARFPGPSSGDGVASQPRESLLAETAGDGVLAPPKRRRLFGN